MNALANGLRHPAPLLPPSGVISRKRKRIIQRLAQGFTGIKKRKFYISNIKEYLRPYTRDIIVTQIRILESHAVVTQPTKKSVELMRTLSASARAYLLTECQFAEDEIIQLDQANSLLVD